MDNPPFFWRGCDAIADFIEWQTNQQAEIDRALIAGDICPVIEDEE